MLQSLKTDGQKIHKVKSIQVGNEIACITMSMGPKSLIAVGFWHSNTITLYTLDLVACGTCEFSGDTIPRSIIFADYGIANYLMVGLGDGTLFLWTLKGTKLSARKSIVLGTQPITLHAFQNHVESFVFCLSDRPTIICNRGGKMVYSSVNLEQIASVCCFHSRVSEFSIAVASGSGLMIGQVDAIQKLHVQTIPIGETVRRIAQDSASGTIAILTTKAGHTSNGEWREISTVRILDDKVFAQLDNFQLDSYELAASLLTATIGGSTFYMVGTGYAYPTEDDPKEGRILVFSVIGSRRLNLDYCMKIEGCAYALVQVQQRIVAAVNSKVHLLQWTESELEQKCVHHGHIVALSLAVRGDFIIVADLLKSISVLNYTNDTLEEVGRDFDTKWMTAVEALEDDVFIGAENNSNMFLLTKPSEGNRLVQTGAFHVGDMINKFRAGSRMITQAP